LGLRSGNPSTTFGDGAQIEFSNHNNHQRHFIHTRHNVSNSNNAIDFYVSNGTTNNTVTSGSVHNMSLVSGKVGIGVTNAATKLHVVDDGPVTFASIDGVNSAIYSVAGAKIVINNRSSQESAPSTDETKSHGKIIWAGYNRTKPSAYIESLHEQWDDKGHLAFATSNDSNGTYERMRITSAGGVGIGTTDTNHANNALFPNKLLVNGKSTFTDNLAIYGYQQKGINLYSPYDKTNAMYMTESTAAGQSFAGGSPCGGYGFSGISARFRCYNDSLRGFIWENHQENLLMSLRAHNGALYIAGECRANSFPSHSDSRIKTNITDVVDDTALQKLRLLQPKTYTYKDTVSRGTNRVYGFIAQEIKQVIPEAIQIVTEIIPNIYELANVSTSEDGSYNVISFTNFDTANLHTDSNKLKLVDFENTPRYVKIIETIDSKTFRIDTNVAEWMGAVDASGNVTRNTVDASGNVIINGTKIHVYGEEVDDSHVLNKAHIWTVATAALQEVDRQLQAEKAKTATLETEVSTLKTQVTDLLARVTALESA